MEKLDKYFESIQFGDDIIKQGDWFQLADLLGEDLKKSRFYNSKIESPIEICIPTNRDFKSVYLQFIDESSNERRLIRLHRLFSLSFFRITKIGKLGDEYFLFAKNIIVNLRKAKVNNEILIGKENNFSSFSQEIDYSLINGLVKAYRLVFLGVFLEEEIIDTLTLKYSGYLMEQKKWQIFNGRRHNGSFYNFKEVADFVLKYKNKKD